MPGENRDREVSVTRPRRGPSEGMLDFMKLAELERKLIAAARANAPGDRVPYAFEKRIMARLAARPAFDHWALWGRALWQGAVSCAAIALLFGAWTFFGPELNKTTGDLSQDFESAVYDSSQLTVILNEDARAAASAAPAGKATPTSPASAADQTHPAASQPEKTP